LHWSENVVPLIKQNPDKSIILMEGLDLRMALAQSIDLRRLLKGKLSALNLESEPYLPAATITALLISVTLTRARAARRSHTADSVLTFTSNTKPTSADRAAGAPHRQPRCRGDRATPSMPRAARASQSAVLAGGIVLFIHWRGRRRIRAEHWTAGPAISVWQIRRGGRAGR
jgi:hypothetical protein